MRDFFAGIPVRDYGPALAWYEKLFGGPPAFLPNDVEAVWELAEHRYAYIVVRPEDAGHALAMLFVDDLDTHLATLAGRGLHPVEQTVEGGGVRKVTFRDPDGNEFSFGGLPSDS
jgi:catechol 2,3-dioxygenase-like lactoylglutathione lyase family enzyme